MHRKSYITAGKSLTEAKHALVLIHGRGATAEDIIGLGSELNVKDFVLVAPQATNYTWYPYSFLAPVKQNEPWLSSAIQLLDEVVNDIRKAGIEDGNIFFTGFSQGACLTLEYTARHARKWGGVAAFTGGLIGDKINRENYPGNFSGTPVFIGTSDPDPHVPVQRVQESAAVLKSMNADVTVKEYPGIGHTITREEITMANSVVFQSAF